MRPADPRRRGFSIDEMRRLARRALPRAVFDFADGAAEVLDEAPDPLAATAVHGPPLDDDQDDDGSDDERAEVDEQADAGAEERDEPSTESEAQRLVDLLGHRAQPHRPRVERPVVLEEVGDEDEVRGAGRSADQLEEEENGEDPHQRCRGHDEPDEGEHAERPGDMADEEDGLVGDAVDDGPEQAAAEEGGHEADGERRGGGQRRAGPLEHDGGDRHTRDVVAPHREGVDQEDRQVARDPEHFRVGRCSMGSPSVAHGTTLPRGGES